VGIVMRKTLRRENSSTNVQQLGKSIFSLEGSGDDEEDEVDSEGELEEGELLAEKGVSVGSKRELVDAFQRLGIDVRTPPAVDDDEDVD
jgi:hypothetical protein